MNWHRIHALMSRNIKLTFRGVGPLIDFFYWPLFDIVLWGFTSTWMDKSYNSGQTSVSLVVLSGLALWQIAYRCNLDIAFHLLEEIWSHNVVNLFSTPLKLSEWIASAMLLAFCNAIVAITFASVVIFLLYNLNILSAGWPLLIFVAPLVLSGWTIGFLTSSALICLGMRVQKLVWVMGWFFVPFSNLFYPIDTLPSWAKFIAYLTPMSYVFGSLRIYLSKQVIVYEPILTSYALSFLYLTLALCLFIFAYNKSKSKGLSRLDSE